MKHITIILLLTVCVVCGCGRQFPPDFPAVYPMTVTVTNGGTPIEGVKVAFYPVLTGQSYAAFGTTNTSGVAKIFTIQGSFDAAGIPAGDYVVAIQEEINVDMLAVDPIELMKLSDAEKEQLRREWQKKVDAYPRKVPVSLNQNSPIRFTAKETGNTLTVDVAEYFK
jgi:hypothetical protein